MSQVSTVQLNDGALVLPFPLRKFFMAQIVVPRDMTKAEADRLCAFVQSLVATERSEQKEG